MVMSAHMTMQIPNSVKDEASMVLKGGPGIGCVLCLIVDHDLMLCFSFLVV